LLVELVELLELVDPVDPVGLVVSTDLFSALAGSAIPETAQSPVARADPATGLRDRRPPFSQPDARVDVARDG
jgi:hypothetical protein